MILIFGRVICLSDLGNILAYYMDKTTLLTTIQILDILCILIFTKKLLLPFFIEFVIFPVFFNVLIFKSQFGIGLHITEYDSNCRIYFFYVLMGMGTCTSWISIRHWYILKHFIINLNKDQILIRLAPNNIFQLYKFIVYSLNLIIKRNKKPDTFKSKVKVS
jgi:hypothetical protein